ncbi:hypothetical protein AAFP35_13090 [Gordonia sp. CPCC 206044]|uniref:sacsin N-terminal ATP-binding-like domain-containing protein n=1 Tax=Gordonia sp. CPCC 206044 TaxID=3140793 RepID=UPI003AF3886B
MPASADDPFELADLRSSTLASWRGSPTRFAEDSAVEADLVTVGYRDRLFTELAANAADAAAAAGVPGRLAIWARDRVVHVANTGAPLSAAGARSLLSLRVSAKRAGDAGEVGRFGVGFTTTATVADRVEVRSTTGSLAFDRDESAAVAGSAGVVADGVRPPLLRLAWPVTAAPAPGFDTEIVLHLRDDVSVEETLSAALAQAPDLLLELPTLAEITVDDTRVTIDGVVVAGGQPPAESSTRTITVTVTSPRAVVTRTWFEAARGGTRWLVESDDSALLIEDHHRLCAPTPTDIDLSLPARCITDLPLTPDRRHLHPEADIVTAATGYADLAASVPASWRPHLVPVAARAVNRDDAVLIDAVIDELRQGVWLPSITGDDLVPGRAVVLPDLTGELADVLAPIVGDLAHPDVSERREVARLRSVGVGEIGLAQLVERLVGVEREPSWWRELYAALSPLVTTAIDAEELGAIPIPRSDGRMSIGARGLRIADHVDTAISWVPTVHPQARHPLLERLGAQAISVEDALADPALEALVESADEDDAEALADQVFALLAAEPSAAVPDSLSRLLLPDEDGELCQADELLLPDSPLASVLADDAPFGVLAADVVARVGPDVLRRVGVGWGFLTIRDELPVAPDHDLPDEAQWWDTLDDPPETLVAVRDLDLVSERHWPQALTMLATDEANAPLLADRTGYTAWWLRHHAVVDGRPLGWYRAPSDTTIDGVRDALDHPHADRLAAALGGLAPESAADADVMLAHLGDPARVIAPGVAAAVHTAAVAASRHGVFDPVDVGVPLRVRALSGDAVEQAVVLDRSWLLQVLAPEETVVTAVPITADDATRLAEILDLPTATDELVTTVRDPGDPSTTDGTDAVAFASLWGRDLARGEIRLHDELWIRVRRGAAAREVRVSWWVDERGVTHLQRRFPS